MSWDVWTFLVLALFVLSALRPAWAIVAQRRVWSSDRHKQDLECAGGGAAMLAVAAYLMIGARQAIGRGYWDLVLQAVRAPFMLSLPMVWIPALCWVLLVVLGTMFLFRGARASRGPRHPMTAIWALNEIALFSLLLWLGVYVPQTWNQELLINFGIEGLYIGFLVGAFARFLLAILGPHGGRWTRFDEGDLQEKARHWLGRIRRY
jgi:hypothetical protein